jgi:hypothetical protein
MPGPVLPLFLSTPLLQSKSRSADREFGTNDGEDRGRTGRFVTAVVWLVYNSRHDPTALKPLREKSTSARHCNPPLSQASCRPAGQKPHARRVQTLTLGHWEPLTCPCLLAQLHGLHEHSSSWRDLPTVQQRRPPHHLDARCTDKSSDSRPQRRHG